MAFAALQYSLCERNLVPLAGFLNNAKGFRNFAEENVRRPAPDLP